MSQTEDAACVRPFAAAILTSLALVPGVVAGPEVCALGVVDVDCEEIQTGRHVTVIGDGFILGVGEYNEGDGGCGPGDASTGSATLTAWHESNLLLHASVHESCSASEWDTFEYRHLLVLMQTPTLGAPVPTHAIFVLAWWTADWNGSDDCRIQTYAISTANDDLARETGFPDLLPHVHEECPGGIPPPDGEWGWLLP